ncbi:MAG: hypothetical protein PHS63_09225 [Desulfoplanes sp.]|nr:hypothetical protein [Desulfoplanes sp.]
MMKTRFPMHQVRTYEDAVPNKRVYPDDLLIVRMHVGSCEKIGIFDLWDF